jgi:uncharacterized membrane protein YhaH (DUF805 family)
MMSNRIARLELLFWCGAPIIVGSLVLTIVALSVGAVDVDIQSGDPKLRSLLAPVALLASIVILKAAVSRLHDLGWPGWVVLLAFVPLVDILFFLALLTVPGQKKTNAYGAPPMFLERWRKSKQPANS